MCFVCNAGTKRLGFNDLIPRLPNTKRYERLIFMPTVYRYGKYTSPMDVVGTGYTPAKTNMEPENNLFEQEHHFPNLHG